MCNDLGHKVNMNEARVLLASANNKNNNKLSLDEFLELVYNDKDTPLNVNLSKIIQL